MSDAERALETLIRWNDLPEPTREFRFAPPRLWRFDFAWPERHLAVEVEGGIWSSGRHSRGAGFEADCIKYNEAALAGWLVLRVTPGMIDAGEAIDQLKRALGDRT
jgi:very-short-patch-repair endonuclease